MKKYLIFFSILTIILSSCGTTSKAVNKSEPLINEQIILQRTPEKTPEWTYKFLSAKKDYPEYECFIGVSKPGNTEQTSRNNAEEDCMNKVINYLGTYGEKILKKITTTTGVDFIDAADAGKQKSTQIAKNFVRNNRPIEIYTEYGKIYRGKQYWEHFYKVQMLYGFEKAAMNKAQKDIITEQKNSLRKQMENERKEEKKQLLKKAIDELDNIDLD